MRGYLSSGRAGLKRTADAIQLEEDKALWFSEPMGGGGGPGLSHAFLRSCSEQNLPVGDTVYKTLNTRKKQIKMKNKNMYR